MAGANNMQRDLRVVVVAPTGRDASLLCSALARAGMGSVSAASCDIACHEVQSGAGCLIVAEEALTAADIRRFADLIADQPAWSDFPLIVLTLSGEVTAQTQRRRMLRAPLARALELERPIRPETLVSTVQGALRARRRQYELRDQIAQQHQTEEALRRSEKLAVAGRLAASIAHEINNPLEAVMNLVYLARTSGSRSEAREFLVRAEAELARVAAITTETLKFYRQAHKPSLVEVEQIFESLLVLYRQKLLAAGVTVETDFRKVKPILAYGGELRQMFSNLLSNAIDAAPGGSVRIRVRPAKDARGNAGVRVLVADNGVGISQVMKRSIFEPFVSTKGARGTGLGLWVSSELVQKHGGVIRLKSSTAPSRHGTVFSVFLPLSSAAVSAASVAAAPPSRQPETMQVSS